MSNKSSPSPASPTERIPSAEGMVVSDTDPSLNTITTNTTTTTTAPPAVNVNTDEEMQSFTALAEARLSTEAMPIPSTNTPTLPVINMAVVEVGSSKASSPSIAIARTNATDGAQGDGGQEAKEGSKRDRESPRELELVNNMQATYLEAVKEMMAMNRANAAEAARLTEERHKIELEKAQLLSDKKVAELEGRLESVKSSGSEGGSERNIDHLVEERVGYETSVGWLKTDLFLTNGGCEELPADFPPYGWPKFWKGRQKMARALLYMRDLIKTKTLYECVVDMSRM